ncbi:hypothetical protein CTI14_68575, partial [Methylobacterium radiotolerans]
MTNYVLSAFALSYLTLTVGMPPVEALSRYWCLRCSPPSLPSSAGHNVTNYVLSAFALSYLTLTVGMPPVEALSRYW